jgi:hypothetical protein
MDALTAFVELRTFLAITLTVADGRFEMAIPGE